MATNELYAGAERVLYGESKVRLGDTGEQQQQLLDVLPEGRSWR